MNHALAIYTALFLSIIYLTVSIYSSDIRASEGESLALLVFIGALSMKVAIDDYVHFHKTHTDKERLHVSLWFSLILYLLLAASAASAATKHIIAAEILMICSMLLGFLWILVSVEGDIHTRVRHNGWVLINLVIISVLFLDLCLFPAPQGDASVYLQYLLTGVVIFDALYFGTLRRLAEL